jgi:cold shock CspA family protein
MKGTIKNIIPNRNFGFIRTGNGGDYFFHRQDFQGHWEDLETDYHKIDVQVTFDVAESPKGLRAANVRRLDYPNQNGG